MTEQPEATAKTVLISGGFDPIHPGLLDLIEAAKELGEVHIALNSDDWLVRKKGFYFQPFHDRKRCLEVYTPHIHAFDDSDGTACAALEAIRPDIFANGGEASRDRAPEAACAARLGIEMKYDVGGNKYKSSTEINGRNRVLTRWGRYDVILDMPELKVKMLHVDAGKELSLQRHEKRSEFFFMPNGEVRMNLPGVWHVLKAPEDRILSVLEVQLGTSEEEDIAKVSERDEVFAREVASKIELNTTEHPEVVYQYRH